MFLIGPTSEKLDRSLIPVFWVAVELILDDKHAISTVYFPGSSLGKRSGKVWVEEGR